MALLDGLRFVCPPVSVPFRAVLSLNPPALALPQLLPCELKEVAAFWAVQHFHREPLESASLPAKDIT